MVSFLANFFSLISAALGALIALPDENETIRPLQIGLNELSWVPAALGIFGALTALIIRPRSWFAVVAGLLGFGFSVRPYLLHRAASDDMTSAMRAGLGEDYEAKIPPLVRARLAPETWSLGYTFGEREKQSQGRLSRDTIYAAPGGHELHFDVYQPVLPPPVGEHYPALVVLHGGGWRNGDRGGWFAPHNRYFASQGYVVFDVQYRLSGVAKWPAPLEDVRAALRWIRAHGDEYQIDPARIALMGRSAGAHLALMAAFCPDEDTKVSAVVSIYGPAEMRWEKLESHSAIFGLIGGSYEDMPAAYDSATPLNFVRDGLPPTLMIEGGMDTLVPYYHGDLMSRAMALTNTPFVLLRSPWSRHGFDAALSGLGAQLTLYHLDRFLAWSFYGDRHA